MGAIENILMTIAGIIIWYGPVAILVHLILAHDKKMKNKDDNSKP